MIPRGLVLIVSVLMGSYEEERGSSNKRFQKITKTWIACLGSFLVSMAGGLILSCWEFKYHPTNSQLWMVPIGLILFFTPVIVWFSVFISEICNFSKEANVSSRKQPSIRLPHSAGDLEGGDHIINSKTTITSSDDILFSLS